MNGAEKGLRACVFETAYVPAREKVQGGHKQKKAA